MRHDLSLPRGRREQRGSRRNGADATFTTATRGPTAPTVATGAANAITDTTATLNGLVSSTATASTTVSFQHGLTTSYGGSAPALQSPLPAGALNAPVSAAISGLACNTTYHFRAVGGNSVGANGADTDLHHGGVRRQRADRRQPPRRAPSARTGRRSTGW